MQLAERGPERVAVLTCKTSGRAADFTLCSVSRKADYAPTCGLWLVQGWVWDAVRVVHLCLNTMCVYPPYCLRPDPRCLHCFRSDFILKYDVPFVVWTMVLPHIGFTASPSPHSSSLYRTATQLDPKPQSQTPPPKPRLVVTIILASELSVKSRHHLRRL